jgi:UDP-glucose 4-epimerase/UDP-glucuronate decarboxylase
MRVVITGAAGFIGYHLARQLADQEKEVILCDNLLRGQADDQFAALIRRPNVTFVNIDLTDRQSLSELDGHVDLIYHLAAINGTRHFYEIPHQVLRNNLLCSINVLDWLSSGRGAKMVWTSSSEVYAGTVALGKAPVPTPEAVAIAIDDIANPRFSYAASKIAGESLCLNYASAYGLPIAIVRPHNVYGPRMGNDHVIAQFTTRMLERKDPFPIYGGEQTRAFCFIADLVQGLQLVGESRRADGQTINLGNDQEEVRIADLAHKLFALAGFQPRVENLPAPEGSVTRRCPDITKARELLGFRPQVDLEIGLRKTYEWYSTHQQARGDV